MRYLLPDRPWKSMARDVQPVYRPPSFCMGAGMKRKPTGLRPMALTADLVARVERIEPDPGPEPGTAEHTDTEFDSLVEQLLSEHRPEALWSLPMAR